MLFRFAVSLCKSRTDAADLVQHTYLKWVKHRDGIRDVSKTRSWLFTTLYREFVSVSKKQHRMSSYSESEWTDQADPQTAEAGRGLDGEWAMAALQHVPDPYRAALTLFYVQDFSYLEIADVLEVSPGTVMSRIYRGKTILKQMITEREKPGTPGSHLKVLRQEHGS